MKGVFVAVAFFLLPTLAYAADFATQSIFLSQDSVTQGQSVLIHAVVSNTSGDSFTGSIKFLDGTNSLGEVALSIPSEGAQVASISWEPTAGSHTITANLYDANDAFVVAQEETFFIAAAPSSVAVSSIESSEPLESAIANVSPGIAQDIGPAFSAIDAGRTSAEETLNNGITWAQAHIVATNASSSSGEVLGAQTESTTTSGITHTAELTGAMIALYVFSILRYVVSNIGFFYPVVALLFFYILWKIFRGMQRRRY